MTTWRFELEENRAADVENELSAEQMAVELMGFGGDGYVYDDDTIIPVRRIVAVKRLERAVGGHNRADGSCVGMGREVL